MTKLSKAMVVLITFCSVGFMAFALVNVLAGGPNYNRWADKYGAVVFEQANPEAPWTVKKRTSGEDMGSGPIKPAAIIAAQRKLQEQATAEQTQLETNLRNVQASTAAAKSSIDVDLKALTARGDQLSAQLKTLGEEIAQTYQSINEKTDGAQAKLDTTTLRRDEYIQLKNQLEDLVTQRMAVTYELARLRDLLYQAKLNLDRTRLRTELLKSDGVPVGDYEGPAMESPATPETETPAAEEDTKS